MRRIISVFVSVIIALSLTAPFAYAEKDDRFTVTNNEYTGSAEFATREVAIASFIRAVGMEKFKTDDSILDGFSDKIKISYTYVDEMSAAVYSGLIDGYEDKTLRPQSPITRAEALVIVNRALSRTELPSHYEVTFTDTPLWAKKQINRLAAAGIVKGYGDGTVGAYDYLTHAQVTALCDRIIRFTGPCGDYYNYVNSQWLGRTSLNDGILSYSEADKAASYVNNCLSDIIFSLYRRYYNDGEKFEGGSDEKKIIDVYSAAADMGYRDRIGFAPIQSYLSAIDGADSIDEITVVMADLEKAGFTTLIPVVLDTNIYDTSKFVPSVISCYTGLDKSYINGDNYKKYLSAYKDYIAALFKLQGDTPRVADHNAELVATLCHSVLGTIDNTQNTGDISKTVRLYKASEFKGLYSNIDTRKYLSCFGYEGAESVMVYDSVLAEKVNSVLKAENLPTIKQYLRASVLDASSLYLTTEAFDAYVGYQDALSGKTSDLIPSDYAVHIVNEILGWELGKLYVDMYFPETAKPAIEDMTEKIIAEFVKMINNSVSLSPQERTAAVAKLKNIKINVAYPEDISGYRNETELRPISEGGSLMEYKIEYSRDYSEYCAALIKEKPKADRSGWTICPQTVNAMYDPMSNSITVPAGIIQPPYYDQSAEFEENLGGIGTVIAHEISHAFDTVGVQFDEKGNLIADKDKKVFVSLGQINRKIVDEYEKISVGGSHIDGNRTLDENFADVSGMSCILSLAGADNPKLDALFRAYAKSWRTKTTKEYQKLILNTDSHSPASVRVNRVLSNFAEFEDFYGVADGDGMYIPDSNKINIWK